MKLSPGLHKLSQAILVDKSQQSARNRLEELTEKTTKAIPNYYLEHEPSASEWLASLVPTKEGTYQYLHSLFPSIGWVPRYNWRWLLADSIAGLTVGLVVVPQAMAYALLATLSPDFGLYTSFAGAATYWLFGTSKDIVIGTTAVGSLLVGNVITSIQDSHPGVYTNEEIAKTLSFITGAMLLAIGLLRLGWVVEVIPYIPISAFITAASITIMSTQFPVMMGIPGINTREEPYKVIINSLRNLGNTQLDAAIGISCLILLDLIKRICAKMEVRQPSHQRLWATISCLRLSFAMLFYTFISWLVNRGLPKGESEFRIVGTIQSGFKHAGVPRLDAELVRLVIPQTPIMMVILVIEHIAIAKNFGKQFGYQVIPSQEIMAQGTANLLGPFLGGYACTGSFGASAVLAKAGVKTPLAGLFSALVLLLALYALTAVFYYIPRAALAGLIIHAVLNLVASPKTCYKYWRISPFEFLIWIVGVVVAIFTGLETSIYTTIGLSLFLLIVRIARTNGQFLGRVPIWQVAVDLGADGDAQNERPQQNQSEIEVRDAYIPMDRKDASNPEVIVQSPYPGVFVYRFPEGFNYLNKTLHLNNLTAYILKHTRRTTKEENVKSHQLLWCESRASQNIDTSLPILRAIVLDCSSVNNIDITGVQGLIDARNALDRHAAPSLVDWHFAALWNRWSRRALATAGFGYPAKRSQFALGNWTPVYSLTSSFAGAVPEDACAEAKKKEQLAKTDCESKVERVKSDENNEDDLEVILNCEQRVRSLGEDGTAALTKAAPLRPVFGLDRPFFHIDLGQAVSAAVRCARMSD
ncbi:uncharacterized protein A1O5_03330 [Cladophialophora psammophila CBS 110553]|uniref:STAS domain-containing protein n=1 Tax=Cladophialophora psammophila CBS 110553 TaxID=1182543 RepID=W9XTF4_9EURO|nr:uncharacterized protein A1O5_03330 [Cladophialophora psammophila CBS 110553]EXJ73569.1 hypothetical protein A1O5_03330 [Cladophialophora psammophila CBS 110553]